VDDVDAGDAIGPGKGTVDATDENETESEADVAVPCGPPTAGTYFVDPNGGHDDDGGTGSAGCPFKSLTHALSLVGDAGAPLTVQIVNASAAPTLSQSTGEVFPITVPGGVTITAEDTTKNAPLVLVAATSMPGGAFGVVAAATCGAASSQCPYGFYLPNSNTRLTHLIIDGQSLPGRGRGILAVGGVPSVGLDHVTVQHFGASAIGIIVGGGGAPSTSGPTLGPGVVVRESSEGLHVRFGRARVLGGHGSDHSSFTANGTGIWVEAAASIDIEGTNIDPAQPDTSDVDVDANSGVGLLLNPSGPAGTMNTVRGLHVGANQAVGIDSGLPLTLRGSYVGGNAFGGIHVERSGPPGVDMGNPVGPDFGRNIFVGNMQGDICGYYSEQQPVLAAGNIFGAIDCAVGGKLAPTIFGPQAYCGDPTTLVVSNCTF
jgi:hypothetical protein